MRGSYDVIYQRIKSAGSTSQKVADRAIRWILSTQRSLNVKEFIAAISVDFNGNFVPLSVSQVLDICCNMLVLDEELEIFRFAHLSVREYFEGLKSFDKVDRHAFVLERCIDTITSELQNPSKLTLVDDESLMPYAGRFWLEHLKEAGNIPPTTRVNEKIIQFLVEGSDASLLFISWLSTYSRPGRIGWTRRTIKSFPYNPLFVLIYCGSSSIIRQLGMLKDQYWIQKNHGGMSCIGFAASLGYWEIVRLFLERENFDINDKDEKGCTPLMEATKTSDMTMLQTLLKHEKIDVNVQDNNGHTPLMWATMISINTDCRVTMHTKTGLDDKRRDGQTTSLKGKNCQAIVQLLLKHKDIDINKMNNDNQTSLHFAALYGHEAMMSLLLEQKGIDVNVKSGYGGTPLLVAARSGYEEVVRRLLAYENVDVNARNMGSETSLFVAARSGYEEVVRLLLDHNEIDANAKDEYDQTPLYVAISQGREAATKLLLKHKDVDVNGKCDGGNTPLLIASCKGYRALVRLLLEHEDIDINAKNDKGETPLYMAMLNGHDIVVKMIRLKSKIMRQR